MKREVNAKHIYHKIIEPVIAIDLVSEQMTYCNQACYALWDIHEGMSISELEQIVSTDIDYALLRTHLLENGEDFFSQDVSLFTKAQGIITGTIQAGYIHGEKNQIYIFFEYDEKEVDNIVLKKRCYDSIYARSYSYPFRLDITSKTIYFIGPILELFNLPPVIDNYPTSILESQVLPEDTKENFRKMVCDMYNGRATDFSFRSYTADGLLLWYQPQYTVTRNEQGEPIELIGEFVNIQEKKEMQTLLDTDELTQCLNKTAFQKYTEAIIARSKPNEKHALFMIDIDNFKVINDNLGHLFGDMVLKDAGVKLQTVFREGDYIGRIGGDEFMVLVPNIKEDEPLDGCARRILNVFDMVYKGNMREYHTTASIGISLFPQHGTTFDALYQHADMALYETKDKGKNGYTYYHQAMVERNMRNTTPFDTALRALSRHFDHQLIVDIFSLLTTAKDYSAAINKTLELLGLRFHTSRSHIFEYNPDTHQYLDNTFEWCAPNITSEKANLQMLPKSVYKPFIERMNADGIFYCNDLEEFKGTASYDVMYEQGIKSFLFAFNMQDGDMVSVVGFDDCEKSRLWNSVEIGTLMHASKIINQFMLYKKALTSIETATSEKMKVLDSIYSYAYITDSETHKLHYFNREFQNAFPHVKFGATCYEVLHNRTQACEDCPMKQMQEQKKAKFRCIMPMQSNGKRMLTNVSDIGDFHGHNSMFFSCSSIDDLDYDAT